MGPWLKVSPERPEKRGIDLAIPELIVDRLELKLIKVASHMIDH